VLKNGLYPSTDTKTLCIIGSSPRDVKIQGVLGSPITPELKSNYLEVTPIDIALSEGIFEP
jgi:hypothetical protein